MTSSKVVVLGLFVASLAFEIAACGGGGNGGTSNEDAGGDSGGYGA